MATKKNGNNTSLQELIAQLDKTIGVGTIMLGRGNIVNVDFISTGIITLDLVLGGGIPRGRIVELFGAEGSGKTTTTLEIIAACQRTFFEKKNRQGVAAFVDAEHAFDPAWARHIGVDVDNMLINQPNSGEEGLRVVEELSKSGLVDLIVIDSLAALTPQEELDGEIIDKQIGAQPRMMSKALRRLNGPISKSGTSVIFINQLREKIGVMFGSPEATPGGRALKFYASVRLDVRKGQVIKEGKDEQSIGHRVKVKIVKNKIAPPFKICEYDMCFGNGSEPIFGVDKIGAILDAAVETNIIAQSGSWFTFGKQKLGLGRSKSVALLRSDENLRNEIIGEVMKRIKLADGPNLRKATDEELSKELESGE